MLSLYSRLELELESSELDELDELLAIIYLLTLQNQVVNPLGRKVCGL